MTETEYWKRVSLWMASVHAANYARVRRIKSIGKRETERQESITRRCIDYLDAPIKELDPKIRRQEGFESVLHRLRGNLPAFGEES